MNPDRVGTKAALHYAVEVRPAGPREIRLRLAQVADPADEWSPEAADRSHAKLDLGARLRRGDGATGRREADEFFADVTPAGASADEAMVLRQAVAGLMWGKQFYHYDVARWLAGDPHGHAAGAEPPAQPRTGGTCRASTSSRCPTRGSTPGTPPGTWPSSAWPSPGSTRASPRSSCCCCCASGTCTPTGRCRPTSGRFDDVNPPVHAWAALRVFELDGARDYDFLARVLHKLLMNFTWWVNRKDSGGNNVFEGGFLGLDNVGPFDRGAALPVAGVLEQSRRHRLDGDVRAQHARDEPGAGHPPTVLCGPGHEVPRALRLHRRGRLRAGPVGRGGRVLLRRDPPAGRRRRCR